MFNRRPISLLLASAVAMLTGVMARRGVPMLQDQVTTNEGNSRPSRRQRITPVRYKRSTYHRDEQRQASLRRRMGGNGIRIIMARRGRVFSDPPTSGPYQPRWIESPRVLPEEVEAHHKELVRDRNTWRDPKHAKAMGNYIPCGAMRTIPGEPGSYDTEIRGMRVRVYPTYCGPIRFKQLMEEAA